MTVFLVDVGHSMREAFYMFWETLWALVLGFTLSGVVQAFVSRESMQRRLGDHRPGTVARASLYGMVSSSCSYAASAMARSLVGKGADFVAAMTFMFASTNLVVELGLVLLVLVGWQFVAAEFVGGVVMIALLVVAGGLWLRGRVVVSSPAVAMEHSAPGPSPASGSSGSSGGPRWRQRSAWGDGAGYTISDLTMLRREMVIGFLVAGFLTELVPAHVWSSLFVHGHGFWTSLENAVVGPLVAVVSFVCSIGNVPLAAALWKGGIAFGGVVSFVFADLITLPLLLIYRKQYGGRMALRMLGVFWLVMSAAGLATEYLFRALGWIPAHHPVTVAADALRWDYTTVLDIVALVGFAAVYRLYRHRPAAGADGRYAKDPVCGMQVEVAHAPAWSDAGTGRAWFCSEHCRDRFEREPSRYAGPASLVTADDHGGDVSPSGGGHSCH